MKPEDDPEWSKLWEECLARARERLLVRYDANLLGGCALVLFRSEGARQEPLIRELAMAALAADMALQSIENFLLHAERVLLSARSRECVVKGQRVVGLKCHLTEQEMAAVMVAKEQVAKLFVECPKIGRRCKEPGWDPGYEQIHRQYAEADFEDKKESALKRRAREQRKRDDEQARAERQAKRATSDTRKDKPDRSKAHRHPTYAGRPVR